MLEVSELNYAAIITIELPGMSHPATVSLTLTPPDTVETAPGQYKPLRDCTLADIQAFAEAIEDELWQKYRSSPIDELATDDASRIKITLINEGGKALALSRAQVLEHGIRVGKPRLQEAESTPETVDTAPEGDTVEDEAGAAPVQEADETSISDIAERNGDVVAPVETPQHEPAEAVDEETTAEPELTTGPDGPARVEELRIAGLRRPLGHPTPAAVDILINEPAIREAQVHALSSMDREVAGMLVGPRPEKQPDGRYVVHITDVVEARHTRMMGASVTYTPESWRYVTDRLQERYPNEEAIIVGWYHTHPGFGIFLSGMDLFIHQNFFTQIWHVALVLDPRATRMGFFCWDRKQSEVRPYEFPWPEWAAGAW